MTTPHRDPPMPLVDDFLTAAARARPTREALVCGDVRWTYAELDERASALAASLARRGVERGDRVLILGENSAEVVVSFWAAQRASAVPVVVSPQTKRDKLAYLLADCRPRALIADAALGRVFAGPAMDSPHLATALVAGRGASEALGELNGAETLARAMVEGANLPPPPKTAIDLDLATIIYTSGSTGEPKGVMHTHQSVRAAALSITRYLENDPSDVILAALPLSFDYGLYQVIMAAAAGASVVVERSMAYPARALARVASERITGFPGVPTVFAMMRELAVQGFDLQSVRYVTNTAAALAPSHVAFLRELFPAAAIYSMYGLTECKRVSYLPPSRLEDKADSVGVAIPGTELWIADESGNRLGRGEVGEIVVRGATVMRGYWEKPEATARRLRPGPLPGERVLHTGDLGMLDDEGLLYFVGRSDDVIKSRGEKVAPREVELALLAIPTVREAAVVGEPDPVLGQAIVAYVALAQGAHMNAAAIRRGLRERLESYMVPTRIVLVDELPKTSTGKVKKTDLGGGERGTSREGGEACDETDKDRADVRG